MSRIQLRPPARDLSISDLESRFGKTVTTWYVYLTKGHRLTARDRLLGDKERIGNGLTLLARCRGGRLRDVLRAAKGIKKGIGSPATVMLGSSE